MINFFSNLFSSCSSSYIQKEKQKTKPEFKVDLNTFNQKESENLNNKKLSKIEIEPNIKINESGKIEIKEININTDFEESNFEDFDHEKITNNIISNEIIETSHGLDLNPSVLEIRNSTAPNEKTKKYNAYIDTNRFNSEFFYNPKSVTSNRISYLTKNELTFSNNEPISLEKSDLLVPIRIDKTAKELENLSIYLPLLLLTQKKGIPISLKYKDIEFDIFIDPKAQDPHLNKNKWGEMSNNQVLEHFESTHFPNGYGQANVSFNDQNFDDFRKLKKEELQKGVINKRKLTLEQEAGIRLDYMNEQKKFIAPSILVKETEKQNRQNYSLNEIFNLFKKGSQTHTIEIKNPNNKNLLEAKKTQKNEQTTEMSESIEFDFADKTEEFKEKKVDLIGFKTSPTSQLIHLNEPDLFKTILITNEVIQIDCVPHVNGSTKLLISDNGLLLWQEFSKKNVIQSTNPDARCMYLLFDEENKNFYAEACRKGVKHAQLLHGLLVIPITNEDK